MCNHALSSVVRHKKKKKRKRAPPFLSRKETEHARMRRKISEERLFRDISEIRTLTPLFVALLVETYFRRPRHTTLAVVCQL